MSWMTVFRGIAAESVTRWYWAGSVRYRRQTYAARALPSDGEIAGELQVSHDTLRTHMRHLYLRLGTHRRSGAHDEAVRGVTAAGRRGPRLRWRPLPGNLIDRRG